MSDTYKGGPNTIGSNHYKGGLTPVASLGSKVKTNGERKPVKVTGSKKK